LYEALKVTSGIIFTCAKQMDGPTLLMGKKIDFENKIKITYPTVTTYLENSSYLKFQTVVHL